MKPTTLDHLSRTMARETWRRNLLKMGLASAGVTVGSFAMTTVSASAQETCAELGAPCSDDSECCSGYGCTTSGTCGFVDGPSESDSSSEEACADLGMTCSDDSECCSGYGCTTSGTCGFVDGPSDSETSSIDSLPNTGSAPATVDSHWANLAATGAIFVAAGALIRARVPREPVD